MKIGFEFLTPKVINPMMLTTLEKNYGLKLPPKFKFFLLHFDLGEGKLKIPKFLDEDDELALLGSICFKANGQKLYLNEFLSAQDIFKQHKNAQEDTEWFDKGLLRFGYVGQVGFGGIYIGCHGENEDEVWHFNADSNTKFIKLSNNIFDFVNGLFFSSDFSNLDDNKYSLLFKKWDENFWRVRENDIT